VKLWRAATDAEATARKMDLDPDDPDSPVTHNKLGDRLRVAGRLNEAVAAYHQARTRLEKLVAAFPNVPAYRQELVRSHFSLAQIYGQQKELEKAIAQFAKASELSADNMDIRYWQALTRVGACDLAGYRDACAGLLDRFGQADLPNRECWVLVLAPDAVNDRNRPVHMAEAALRKDPQMDWASTILGAALYRAGRSAEAVQRLNEANAVWEQAATKPAVYSPAYTWFFLAMAHQRQGDAAEARRWLDKAQKWMEQETQDSRNLAWNRRLTLQVLRREAEQRLGDPATDPQVPAQEKRPRAKAPER
jgi:tetratricopeptide (TPR) repeat protein